MVCRQDDHAALGHDVAPLEAAAAEAATAELTHIMPQLREGMAAQQALAATVDLRQLAWRESSAAARAQVLSEFEVLTAKLARARDARLAKVDLLDQRHVGARNCSLGCAEEAPFIPIVCAACVFRMCHIVCVPACPAWVSCHAVHQGGRRCAQRVGRGL